MSHIFNSQSAKILLTASISLFVHGCGSESTSAPVSKHGKDGDDHVCTQQYAPICGKKQEPINCSAWGPCADNIYTTYSNTCYLVNAQAMGAFNDECEGLEDKFAFAEPPVQITELSNQPIESYPVDILNSKIDGDVVTLEVSYSGGCAPHLFSFFVSSIFMESNPVQTRSNLSHFTVDECEALITENISFDLLPLQEFYRRAYGEEHGSVYIQDIGLYTF